MARIFIDYCLIVEARFAVLLRGRARVVADTERQHAYEPRASISTRTAVKPTKDPI